MYVELINYMNVQQSTTQNSSKSLIPITILVSNSSNSLFEYFIYDNKIISKKHLELGEAWWRGLIFAERKLAFSSITKSVRYD